VDKVRVSDPRDECHLQASGFYTWHEQMWDALRVTLEVAEALRRLAEACQRKLDRENDALEAKLPRKDGVIAEVSEEHAA